MHTIPAGLQAFDVNGPVSNCGRWKDTMPKTRDPAAYRLYINARKLWRSKIEWQLTRQEALSILHDVQAAANQGDWGARALMAYFYRSGLGPLNSNHVLDPNRIRRSTDLLIHQFYGKPMPLKIITVGDKTDHGGTVISGSPDHDIRGRAIARLGDKVDRPQSYPGGKPHGVSKIITAHDTFTINGIPVAVEGCTTECGCKLLGSLPATVD